MLKKRKVNQYLQSIAEYVDSCDTPGEVRQSVNYAFVVMLISELITQGIPPNTAALAAGRVTVNLPDKLHVDFPDEFSELIRLYGKSLSVLYLTITEDFTASLVESVYLSFVDDVVLDMSI